MTEPGSAGNRWGRFAFYFLSLLLAAGATAGITALLFNIQERQNEGKQTYVKVVDLDESTVDPKIWAENFPRQYDSYLRTVDTKRTKHGGSEAINKLEQDPRLKILYAGYAFSLDFREERGHAYMLSDQDNTERVKLRKQPGACLHCHASIIPAYRKEGDGDVMKGFAKVCGMDWSEGRKLVDHPVSCLDCHDPKTVKLRVTRPAFLNAIKELAKSEYPLPHFASIERWRQGNRKQEYDVNALASRQEMRTFACAQCHVEYYFKGKKENLLTYPWSKGLKVEQIEDYYDTIGFYDWEHKDAKTKMLKAQHPEFEMWNQGIHARSGVACADCHMPYKREGAIKVSDHWVRSPLLNINNACQVCHHFTETELLSRAEAIQDRTEALMNRAKNATVDLIMALKKGDENKLPADRLEAARKLHRHAQWRLDFVASENSLGFHASQESARILGEAIDYARQGQIELLKGNENKK